MRRDAVVLQSGREKGLNFVLPGAVRDKGISVVEVGPFDEGGLATEINSFFGTEIEELNRINTYVMAHSPEVQGLEELLDGPPFVDPIVCRATLNESLALQVGLSFDYVLQSMLNPGTSDMYGDIPFREGLLKLGYEFTPGDLGVLSVQHFLKGNLSPAQLEDVSAFLANPDLNTRLIIPRRDYEAGVKVDAPIVLLKPEIRVDTYDVLNMSDEELLNLSSTRKLAATLEEMLKFREMYRDDKFISKRKKFGLDEKATDVELEIWFGLRSEHCFHKELNAHKTIEDRVNDPILRRAYEKGYLTRDDSGNYVLEDGIFKTFIEAPARRVFDKLEKRGKNWIADMFRDNAGTVYYDENFMFCIKWETHNSPSNKEPNQGAKTGIDGVNRDIFANMRGTFKAIANFFYYCTGDPSYDGWLPEGVKHPYTLLKGVTQGVREGGNESQIPTLGGGLTVDPRYIAKILVYCGTVGFSPVNSPDGKSYLRKHPNIDDLILVVGQPVGVDGVHGATESSLSAGAHISLGHVQADFSFEQAKWKDWSLECARDLLFNSIGDCGAMGISVMLELAQGLGLEADLERHPRKYKGIQPWQAACSETQNREVPIISPENKEDVFRRAKLHDVNVTELGKLTDSGYAHLKWGDRTVGLIDLEKLSNKEPRKRMHAVWNMPRKQDNPEIKREYSLEDSLCMVISRPDVASKEWFFRQKDSSVKGGTIHGPLVGLKQEVEADATIQKPLETEGRDFGALAYAMGIVPKQSDLHSYYSAQNSFIDMVGKIIAVGGALPDMETPKWDAWAVCGNYCQPNSDSNSTLTKESGEHNLASLIMEGFAVAETVDKLNIPVISGKDSMKCSCVYDIGLDKFLANHDSKFARAYMGLEDKIREDLDKVKEHLPELYDSGLIDSIILEAIPLDLSRHVEIAERKIKKRDEKTGEEYEIKVKSIEIHDPDSYLASCAVKIEDYRKCVNSAFKEEGDLIYVIGTTKNHLGASEYLEAIGYQEDGAPIEGGVVPQADLDEFVSAAQGIHRAIDQELVASCSYIHVGGLAITLSKAAMAGEKGAEISVGGICQDGSCTTDEELLYSKTPGRFIVTIDPKDCEQFEAALGSTPYAIIGKVSEGNLSVTKQDQSKEFVGLMKLKESYQKPLDFGLRGLAA